jgi:hypothetical protein
MTDPIRTSEAPGPSAAASPATSTLATSTLATSSSHPAHPEGSTA